MWLRVLLEVAIFTVLVYWSNSKHTLYKINVLWSTLPTLCEAKPSDHGFHQSLRTRRVTHSPTVGENNKCLQKQSMIWSVPWNPLPWFVLNVCIMYHYCCPICHRRILAHAKQIQCVVCDQKYHMKCITSDSFLLESMSAQFQEWYCQACVTTTLPFNNIEEEREFLTAINHIDNYFRFIESDLIFHPFELNNSDHSSPLIDIDLDVRFNNNVDFQLSSKCNYHDEMTFCESVSNDNVPHGLTLSMCHII